MNFEFEKEKSTISNLDEIVKIGFFLISFHCSSIASYIIPIYIII